MRLRGSIVCAITYMLCYSKNVCRKYKAGEVLERKMEDFLKAFYTLAKNGGQWQTDSCKDIMVQ